MVVESAAAILLGEPAALEVGPQLLRVIAPVGGQAGRDLMGADDDRPGVRAALDDGTLLAATLDVFHTEPLPADSLFWSHPKVTLSPHNAADTDPDAISLYVAEQMARFERGEKLENVVDRGVGY